MVGGRAVTVKEGPEANHEKYRCAYTQKLGVLLENTRFRMVVPIMTGTFTRIPKWSCEAFLGL